MTGIRRLAVIAVAALFSWSSLAAPPPVAPPQSRPHGATYGEWAAAWWQWAAAEPASVNPVLDTTGEYCDRSQSGHVWFLAGSFGGEIERTCTVPEGRALFFPLVNTAWIPWPTDPPEQQTEEFAREIVTYVESATDLFAIVDGVPVADVGRWLERSSFFTVTLPADNVFGYPGPFGILLGPCADEGWYLMLPPLSAGEHTVRFGGRIGAWSTDVTYHLTVR